MPMYFVRFSYTPEAWKGLMEDPQDRRRAVDALLEEVGGHAVTETSCRDSGHIQKIAPHLLFRIPFLMPVEKTSQAKIMLSLIDAFFLAYDDFQPLKRGKPHAKLTPEELPLLFGTERPEEAAGRLRQKGVAIVVVTMGASGCYLDCPAGQSYFAAESAKVVDPTGAGDAFMAGLLSGSHVRSLHVERRMALPSCCVRLIAS